jgi:hypothetical protein
MKIRVALYCLMGGAALLLPGLGVGHAFWWYLSGLALAGAFVPVALFGPRNAWGQLGVIFPLLFIVTVLTTWSEALIFVSSPLMHEHPIRDLISETIMYLIVAVVLTALARVLKLTHDSGVTVARHTPLRSVGLIAVCALAYMLYYFVFGALTYQFFTKIYYPDATALVGRLGVWFWVIQLVRGLLMTLAIVPIVYKLRMERLQSAICSGLLIWVAGGLAPLLLPNQFMGTRQRVIHIIEIFTQNFTLGVTAGMLLRPRSAARAGSKGLSAAASGGPKT